MTCSPAASPGYTAACGTPPAVCRCLTRDCVRGTVNPSAGLICISEPSSPGGVCKTRAPVPGPNSGTTLPEADGPGARTMLFRAAATARPSPVRAAGYEHRPGAAAATRLVGACAGRSDGRGARPAICHGDLDQPRLQGFRARLRLSVNRPWYWPLPKVRSSISSPGTPRRSTSRLPWPAITMPSGPAVADDDPAGNVLESDIGGPAHAGQAGRLAYRHDAPPPSRQPNRASAHALIHLTAADIDNPSISASSAGGTSAARVASAALRARSTRASPTAAKRSLNRSLDKGPFARGIAMPGCDRGRGVHRPAPRSPLRRGHLSVPRALNPQHHPPALGHGARIGELGPGRRRLPRPVSNGPGHPDRRARLQPDRRPVPSRRRGPRPNCR
jgi:hypothetical protein